MKNMQVCLIVCLGMMVVSTIAFGEVQTTTGTIESISINDFRNMKGVDFNEKTFVVTIQLDSSPKMVLGLPPTKDGELTVIQQAMLRLLQDAFLNKWKVIIRWESPLKTSAPILSVTIPRQ